MGIHALKLASADIKNDAFYKNGLKWFVCLENDTYALMDTL